MKLHLKRCVLFLLLGLGLGCYSGWHLQRMANDNAVVKFALTGKVF